MKIKDVINYILETPQNSNKAVLKSILEKLIADTIARQENELYNYIIDDNISKNTDLFGKTIEDLQGALTIKEDTVYGELKYVKNYTGFSDDKSEQSGYYLAIHIDLPEVDGATIKINDQALNDKGITVIKLLDYVPVEKQKFVVEITKGNNSATDTFSLEGIKLGQIEGEEEEGGGDEPEPDFSKAVTYNENLEHRAGKENEYLLTVNDVNLYYTLRAYVTDAGLDQSLSGITLYVDGTTYILNTHDTEYSCETLDEDWRIDLEADPETGDPRIILAHEGGSTLGKVAVFFE